MRKAKSQNQFFPKNAGQTKRNIFRNLKDKCEMMEIERYFMADDITDKMAQDITNKEYDLMMNYVDRSASVPPDMAEEDLVDARTEMHRKFISQLNKKRLKA